MLTSIEAAKTPDALTKDLDSDRTTLEHNEAAVPTTAKEDFNEFAQELRQATEHKELDGAKAADTLKKIQTDAKELGDVLKKTA